MGNCFLCFVHMERGFENVCEIFFGLKQVKIPKKCYR